MIPELAEIDALPGSQKKRAIPHGKRQVRPDQRGLYVCGHVVGAFNRVYVVGVVFRNKPVEDRCKVGADVGVCVLVECQARTRVHEQEMSQTNRYAPELRDLLLDFAGYQVKATRSGRQAHDSLHKHFRHSNRHLISTRYLYGMARVALTCTGEGLGHASRIVSIAGLLRERHAVTICCPPHLFPFMRSNLGSGLRLVPIPYLSFAKIRDRVDVTRTVLRNLPLLPRLRPILRRVKKELCERRIDILVSDYDPFGPTAARQCGIPVLQMNHPSIVQRHRDGSLGALVARVVSRMVMASYDRLLTVSFYDGDIGPVVRPVIDPAGATAGEDIVVYLKACYREPMTRLLRRLGVTNVVVHPDPERDIVTDLHRCRAVIAAAGHQFMSEALVLGKPVFVIPQKHQYEQLLNARMLEASGRGTWSYMDRVESTLPAFLAELDRFPRASSPVGVQFRFDNELELAIEHIEDFIRTARSPALTAPGRPVRGAWSLPGTA